MATLLRSARVWCTAASLRPCNAIFSGCSAASPIPVDALWLPGGFARQSRTMGRRDGQASKSKADAARQKLFAKLWCVCNARPNVPVVQADTLLAPAAGSVNLATAVRINGADPEFNPRLAQCIQACRKVSVPKSRIEAALVSRSPTTVALGIESGCGAAGASVA